MSRTTDISSAVINGLTFEEWCRASGAWQRDDDLPSTLWWPGIQQKWFEGVDPSEHRKVLEPWEDVEFHRSEGRATIFRVVDVGPSIMGLFLRLFSKEDVHAAATICLYWSKTHCGFRVKKAPSQTISWKIFFQGQSVSTLPHRVSDMCATARSLQPRHVSDACGEAKSLQERHEAIVRGMRQTPPPAKPAFERIHKVVCPKCGDRDKFYLVVQAEMQVVAALAPAEGLIAWGGSGVVNKETLVPTRFQCRGCRHEWPIPEALLGSVVRR